MKNTGIIGVLNNPATSINSHSAGMVNIVSKLFDADILTENDDWEKYDQLIIYHGTNFKPGSFNVIGGINELTLIRSKKLLQNINKTVSLDGFQLNEFSKKRKLLTYDTVQDIQTIDLPKKQNLVIGDSHSISVWMGETYSINRNDGKTLYGFLKNPPDLNEYKHIVFYFGNIDIRFHLARQSDPISATKTLINNYLEYASKYNSTITTLLPIEDIFRKIPNTGLYKGKPYFGSWELRNELKNIANDLIINSGLDYITWPKSFCDDNGKLSFDIMEPKQSVHIRPKYYFLNYCNEENLMNNNNQLSLL